MSPDPSAPALPAPRRRRHAAKQWALGVARAALAVGLASFALLWVAALALHWVILPHIDDWRPQVEARAGRALGVPVRIGAIAVRTAGWIPSIELRDVTLHDAAGRPALALPRVVATLSGNSLLLSLARLDLRFEQLLVDGAQLDVRRDAAGRIFVAGIDFSRPDSGGSNDDGAADWLLRQREVALLRGTLRWTDERRGGEAPLALEAVDLVLRNGVRRHALRLDATPPAAWGERFSLRGAFTQPLWTRPGDWRRWSGEAYAQLPRADLGVLGRHVALPFEATAGDGALRAWLRLRDGRAEAVTADVALRAVALRLTPQLQPLVVAELAGRVAFEERDGRGALALQRFGFVTGDGVRWPAGDLNATWQRLPAAKGGAIDGGTFSAARLDLGLLAQTAPRLPWGVEVHRLLADLRPQGVASDLKASWDGPPDAPRHWRVQATARGLGLAGQPRPEADEPGRPGLRNADLTLTASDAGGEARVAIANGALDLPGVFAQPSVPIARLAAQLAWRVEPKRGAAPAITLTVKDATLANADAQAAFSGTWRSGPGAGHGRGGRFPGRLLLDGTLKEAQALRVARYLPLGLPAGTRRYVEQALRGGSVKNVAFRVDGDLADFPVFAPAKAGAPPSGQFRVAGRVENATLAYVPAAPGAAPAWPVATGVFGELVFDRGSMALRDVRGTIQGVGLTNVQGGIADMTAQPRLALDGLAQAPLAALLRWVDTTPVGGWIGGALHGATGGGNAEMKLALALPLGDLARSTAAGSLKLTGNDLRLRADVPPLGNARGRVDFTHKGVALDGVAVQALGGEAVLSGGTQPDGALRFTAQGTASAEGLRRTPELGPLTALAARLSGQAAYRLALGFAGGRTEINLTSTLVGLGSTLPAPLAKAAATALPLRVQAAPLPGAPVVAAGEAPRDLLQIDVGTLVQARYERQLPADAPPRVLRGAIGVQMPALLPAAGVSANVALGQLDVDAWEAVAASLGAPTGSGATGGTGSAGARPAGDDYLPTQVALQVQQLGAGSRRLTRLTAGASLADGVWHANVDADQLNGYVEYRAARAGSGSGASGRIFARLARLSLPKSDAEQVDSLLDQTPASVPGLDIRIDDFELRGKKLGRVEIEAANRGEREWQLTRLQVTTPEARLDATGRWAAAAGPARRGATPQRRAQIDFRLDLADAGALLDRLGTANAIAGGKGRVQGQIGWLGSPLAPDPATMSGQFAVGLDAGRFLKADPGAARLLSVLSLQSLPRRLSLDFRDVFGQGFAFDNVSGDVSVADGVASTANLRMRGAQAAVLMAGRADLARETQDLSVVVVPEINAGAASLAFAAINPALGLATFVAQLVLRQPLISAGTREFHVSGSWAEPKVERVQRSASAPPTPGSAPTPGAVSGAVSAPEIR